MKESPAVESSMFSFSLSSECADQEVVLPLSAIWTPLPLIPNVTVFAPWPKA